MLGKCTSNSLKKVTCRIDGAPKSPEIPIAAIPEGFDWNLWLGPAAKVPFRYLAGDHGETIAMFIQVGSYLLPNNLSANAHGNGYADPNFLISEAIESVQVDGGAFNVVNGTIQFTPNQGFTGNAMGSYTVADSSGQLSNVGYVFVTVNPVPVYMSVSCWNASFAYGANYQCTLNVSSNGGTAQGAISYSFDGGAASIWFFVRFRV